MRHLYNEDFSAFRQIGAGSELILCLLLLHCLQLKIILMSEWHILVGHILDPFISMLGSSRSRGGHGELENIPEVSITPQLQLPLVQYKNCSLAFQGKPKISNSIYHLPILNVIHKFFFIFNTV